ncbi:MAG: T9SS type A sorting domain-containing protein [Chitinophagales bacterium]
MKGEIRGQKKHRSKSVILPGLDPLEKLKIGIYDNAFPHAWLIQEWFLKDIKINFDNTYRENFFTYAHFHAYGGRAPSSLLYHADEADFENHLDEEGDAEILEPTGYPYFMRRFTYFVMQMLSEVNKNDLKYLPANHTMHSGNFNIPPTLFFDDTEEAETVYGYFTNMKNEAASYILDLGDLADLIPGTSPIGFGSATITSVNCRRLYSNSGRSSLFDINTCYESEFHDTEVQLLSYVDTPNVPEITTGLTGGKICITVQKYSVGYFKVAVMSGSRAGINKLDDIISIFPNPTSNSFKIMSKAETETPVKFNIKIYSLSGVVCLEQKAITNESINIAGLPSGIYMVKISDQHNNSTTKKLIKIE